ncbi:DUF922 domain-containing protein [Pseudodesulfovibrio sp.]|uniref:DUF922 domain-containing protein n=1 Tax=unclassified Pseudodesulfovibrio TaxID=2661612 RepID=UPI003B00DDAC
MIRSGWKWTKHAAISRIAILLGLLLLFPALAKAEVTVSTSEKYYIVQGHTQAEILRSLHKHNGKYAALTHTTFKYSYTARQRGKICTITDAKVFLHILYTYPRQVGAMDGPTRKWWKKALKKLTAHELIHGQIARKAAHELERELIGIHNEPCSAFKGIVKARANRIFQENRRRQQEYDRLTKHGLKQERYRGD